MDILVIDFNKNFTKYWHLADEYILINKIMNNGIMNWIWKLERAIYGKTPPSFTLLDHMKIGGDVLLRYRHVGPASVP